MALFSPGYVLPGVHPSARSSHVFCHLRLTPLAFLALIPVPCSAELPQPCLEQPCCTWHTQVTVKHKGTERLLQGRPHAGALGLQGQGLGL